MKRSLRQRMSARLFSPVMRRAFPEQLQEIRNTLEVARDGYRLGPYVIPPDDFVKALSESSVFSDLVMRLELDQFEFFNTDPFEMTAFDRARAVRYAWFMYSANVQIERSVNMWTDFGLGQRVQVGSDDEIANAVIEEFWKADRNHFVTGDENIQNMSVSALNEGELAWAYWFSPLDQDATATVRPVPTDQLEIVWLDAMDKTTPLWYVRQTKDKSIWYPDWRATRDQLERVKPPDHVRRLDADKQETITINGREEPLTRAIMQWSPRTRQRNGRGLPEFLTSFEWANVLKDFMGDRAAVAKKAAMYTENVTVDGGSRFVTQMKNALQSSLVTNSSQYIDRNPPPAAGSDWIQNSNVNREWQSRGTNAGDARFDGRMLGSMVSTGVGIPLHWLGFPDAIPGGLATARELLRPWVEQTQRYQTWLSAFLKTSGEVVLKIAGLTGVQVTVNLETPIGIDIGTLLAIFDALSKAVKEGTFPPTEGTAIMTGVMLIVLDRLGMYKLKDELVKSAQEEEVEELPEETIEALAEIMKNLASGAIDESQVVEYLLSEIVVLRANFTG